MDTTGASSSADVWGTTPLPLLQPAAPASAPSSSARSAREAGEELPATDELEREVDLQAGELQPRTDKLQATIFEQVSCSHGWMSSQPPRTNVRAPRTDKRTSSTDGRLENGRMRVRRPAREEPVA